MTSKLKIKSISLKLLKSLQNIIGLPKKKLKASEKLLTGTKSMRITSEKKLRLETTLSRPYTLLKTISIALGSKLSAPKPKSKISKNQSNKSLNGYSKTPGQPRNQTSKLTSKTSKNDIIRSLIALTNIEIGNLFTYADKLSIIKLSKCYHLYIKRHWSSTKLSLGFKSRHRPI